MKPYRGAVAAFLILGTILFGVGLFLVGDQHKAFSHHLDFYTDLANVEGLNPGAHVRVNGFEAGQITRVDVPQQPTGKFHIRLHVDGKLKNLIRSDSVVTVETDGLVGDKFLLIHNGSDNAEVVPEDGTIPGKEPIELSAILQKVNGTIDQANTTIVDVRAHLDGTLNAITNTVNNTNRIVTRAGQGHGPIGALLNDPQITSDLKDSLSNTRDATANLNQATSNLKQVSVQAGQVMTDFQSRGMIAKADQSVDNVRDASAQLDQTSQQVNTNLTQAFGPDARGHTAGENLQGTLSNINTATSNMTDDTEALKHEFFFRGFFKKRGFYSLDDLSPQEYRSNRFFQTVAKAREWLNVNDAFAMGGDGHQILTDKGKQQIDAFFGKQGVSLLKTPIIVEGYSDDPAPITQLLQSKERAVLIKHYLEGRLKIDAKDIGVMPLESNPPQRSGKTMFDGACIVLLGKAK